MTLSRNDQFYLTLGKFIVYHELLFESIRAFIIACSFPRNFKEISDLKKGLAGMKCERIRVRAMSAYRKASQNDTQGIKMLSKALEEVKGILDKRNLLSHYLIYSDKHSIGAQKWVQTKAGPRLDVKILTIQDINQWLVEAGQLYAAFKAAEKQISRGNSIYKSLAIRLNP